MRTMAVLELREWHFREPVFFGDTVHVVTRVVENVDRYDRLAARERGHEGGIVL